MSSPRVQKIFSIIPEALQGLLGANQNLSNFKPTAGTTLVQGRIDDTTDTPWAGMDAVLIDVTDTSSWSTNQARCIIVAEPGLNKLPEHMRTQSHAKGLFIDGSVRFHLYLETPAAYVGDHATFLDAVKFHLTGQLGGQVLVHTFANGTEPALKGFNGKTTATAAVTDSDTWLIPYGVTALGGS